ncbi:hypothetical protein [Pseudomonas oryzihabitans]|nr:hypothetical protein [Pseudomonas psychrotolerans]MDR6679420.1 hypothetical protein [Pseudomonas psychrotolerans]
MSIPKPFSTQFGRRAADFEQALRDNADELSLVAAMGRSYKGTMYL